MTKVAETRIKYSTLPLNCMELPWIFAAIFGHSRCDILIYGTVSCVGAIQKLIHSVNVIAREISLLSP